MTYLLFFGAGASRPFQIPTMQEMVNEFEKNLTVGSLESQLYSKIKEIQQKAYGYSKVDIESVFSVIQGIASDTKPNKMGYLAQYYIASNNISKEFSKKEIEIAQNLKIMLENFIKEKCKSPLNNAEKTKIYTLSHHALLDSLPGNKTGSSVGIQYNTEWISYTTNYDSVFEDFCSDFLRLIDYFEPEGSSKLEVFDNNKNVRGHHLTYVKLHGSLDWLKEKTGKILKINSGFTRYQLLGEVMLFPIQQKDLYLHPWITLFQDLKYGLRLSSHWIVIGYAFNDEFIFEIFKEAITSEKKLIIISPSANELKTKFPEELRKYIIALPIKFGEQTFPSRILDYFQGVKTLQLKVKKSIPDLGLKSTLPFASLNIKIGDITHAFSKKQNVTLFQIPYFEDITKPELQIEIKIFYDYLNSKDIELQLVTLTSTEVEMDVYDQERYLGSKKSFTDFDSATATYLSEPIKIYHTQLFL